MWFVSYVILMVIVILNIFYFNLKPISIGQSAKRIYPKYNLYVYGEGYVSKQQLMICKNNFNHYSTVIMSIL